MSKKRSNSRRSAGRKPKKPLIPSWLLLLMGVAIGVIIAYAGPLKDLLTHKDPAPQKTVEIQKPVEPIVETPRQEAPPKVVTIIPPAQESKYDFYYRLPKEEVVVKEAEVRSITKPQAVFQEQTKPRTQTTTSGKRYLIQAGSFRTNKDADRRKAALALLGLKSSIEKVNTDSGRWFRVRLGPYNSMDQVNQIRTELHSQKIKTLLINASAQ